MLLVDLTYSFNLSLVFVNVYKFLKFETYISAVIWLLTHAVFKQFYSTLMQNPISDSLMWSSFPCVQNARQMKTGGETNHYE